MEKFYLEIPSIERKNEIIDYINEFVLYNSDINGMGPLDKILEGYTFEQALAMCLNVKNNAARRLLCKKYTNMSSFFGFHFVEPNFRSKFTPKYRRLTKY